MTEIFVRSSVFADYECFLVQNNFCLDAGKSDLVLLVYLFSASISLHSGT